MDIEDRLSITTPEGVTLELILAGAGSRCIGQIVDTAIRLVLTLAVLAIVAATTDDGPTSEFFVGVAIAVIALFGITFAYDVLFETLASGRTPGKRAAGIRVVRTGGGPVGFLSSAVRNLVRIVDFLPVFYGVGLVTVVVSAKNQRLGDMAAGTVVVREKTELSKKRKGPVPSPAPAPSALDVSAVTTDELVTIRRFLDRRWDLQPEPRTRLAQDLADRIAPKVAGADPIYDPERFLEQVASAKAARG